MNRPLKYQCHSGSVETSVEDNCLYGRLLHIDALVSYEGQNRKELEIAFRQAVDDFINGEAASTPHPNRR
ncbi:hypothetical protein ACW9IB_25010 [Pseudomonas sp. SDO524_S393]